MSLPSLPTAELRCPDVVLSESNIERKDEITNKEVSSIPSSESEAPQPPTDNDEKSEAPQPPADKPPTDNDEKSEAPQPSADTADEDEDEETVVVKFDINGITYLKSQDNVIYDMNTHDALGVWNEETSEIDVLPEEDDEEE